MAVYYKFKSAKDYDSIPIDGHFISVANLKEKIFESKHLGRGTDFDLMVSNAQTNEEYLDEAMLIPKNTSVFVRRVPGRPRMNIVTEREETKVVENKVEDAEPAKSSFTGADSSAMKFQEENEWDEFGNDLYAIPEVLPIQSSNPVQGAPPPNKAEEDSKIKALIDTPAFDWQRQTQEGFSAGRGFGRGSMGGRMVGGRGFGRGGLERKAPPPGYICYRCKVPGHFIQHCPTNGDPNYDIKRVKPPTGIPKSMLIATPDGSYALPSGAVAVLKPNEAAFEREIEGLPSTRSITDVPPELRCPLCKEVMKDAVLTSKCCFNSFCDKCIRDHIISRSVCVCGATNTLADDLLPNKTLRDTINRILESNNSSTENAGSMLQIQDMESARSAQPKVPSPTVSATSKGGQMPPPRKDDTQDIKETANEAKQAADVPQQSLEKVRTAKTADISEATLESMTVKEQTSQGSAPLAEDEVQQKLSVSEPGKKKKKKKVRMPANAADPQWRTPQDFAAENYAMSFAPTAACNPYWGGVQLGMDGFMNPYAGTMPYMGFIPGPFDVPIGGIIPQDPFGGQGYMVPVVPPHRDLSEFAMGSNQAPPMSREEFEARKADLRRKREIERRGERDYSKDWESGRELNNNGDVSSMKSKPRPVLQPAASSDHPRHYHRGERAISPERHHHHHYHQRDEREASPERSHHHHRRPERTVTSLDRPPREVESIRLGKRRADQDEPPREVEPVRLGKRRADHDDPSRELEPVRASKRKTDHSGDESKAADASIAEADKKNKLKGSVFSRISFPDGGGSKKRKVPSETTQHISNGYKDKEYEYDPPASSAAHHKASSNAPRDESKGTSTAATMASGAGTRKSVVLDHDSSDDDRHFKRRPSRYEPPPPPPVEWEEDVRPSRSLRERDYERDRGHNKHR